MSTMAKKTKSKPVPGVLKGYFYAFHKREDSDVIEVAKIPVGKGEPEATYEVSDDNGCSCKAAEFGNECRHEQMVKGKFEGLPVKREQAEDLLEEWLDKFRKAGKKAVTVGALAFGEEPIVKRAEAIVCDPDADAPCVLYGEWRGLLTKVSVVRTEDKLKEALYSARAKWANRSRTKSKDERTNDGAD